MYNCRITWEFCQLTLYGTVSNLSTFETSNVSSSLNMHRIRLILVPFNAELNFTHFEPKNCIPLMKGLAWKVRLKQVFDLIFQTRLGIWLLYKNAATFPFSSLLPCCLAIVFEWLLPLAVRLLLLNNKLSNVSSQISAIFWIFQYCFDKCLGHVT